MPGLVFRIFLLNYIKTNGFVPLIYNILLLFINIFREDHVPKTPVGSPRVRITSDTIPRSCSRMGREQLPESYGRTIPRM